MAVTRKLLIEGTTTAAAMRAMGPFFIDELMEDAQRPNSPPSVRRDWYTVAEWLAHAGGPLSREQKRKVGEAWTAYIAFGMAPSISTQRVFDSLSETIAGNPESRPPAAILDVFDRMMATDVEIKEKREFDINLERQKIKEIFATLPHGFKSSGPSNTRMVRRIIFACLIWAGLVFLYAWLFDPLKVGGWDDLETEDFNRLTVISILPPIGALLHAAYRRWVR